MLWFGMASLAMAFAGWTSAYIISSSRDDWSSAIQLPPAFFTSTAVIVLSSLTYVMAVRANKKGMPGFCGLWLWATLALGVAFILLQFTGFSQLVAQGFYFTGPTSSIKASYVFLIAAVHVAHVLAGLVSLIVVLVNQTKGRYSPKESLGLELGALFWHFLDLLWVYLVCFMFFVG